MLPKSQSLESLLVLSCYCYYYYLLLLLLLSLCVCVYPCKQFVVVTIRRTGSWNTIPTLPCLTLPYSPFFYRTLTRSIGIHHRFIVWFLERTIILEDNTKTVPLGTNFKLARELIGIRLLFKSNSASTVAALLNDIFTLVVVVVVVVIIRKARDQTKPNRIYQSSRRKFTFFYEQLAFLGPTPKSLNQYKTRKKDEEDKKTTTSKP